MTNPNDVEIADFALALKVCSNPLHHIPATQMRYKNGDCKQCVKIAEALSKVRAEERERCAQIAESMAAEIIDMQTGLRRTPAIDIAKLIRNST